MKISSDPQPELYAEVDGKATSREQQLFLENPVNNFVKFKNDRPLDDEIQEYLQSVKSQNIDYQPGQSKVEYKTQEAKENYKVRGHSNEGEKKNKEYN